MSIAPDVPDGPSYAELRDPIRGRLSADRVLSGEPETLDLLCIAIAAAAHERVEPFLQHFTETMRGAFRGLMAEVEQNWREEVGMVQAATLRETVAAVRRGVPFHAANDVVNEKLSREFFGLSPR